jgi:hypothetical protein
VLERAQKAIKEVMIFLQGAGDLHGVAVGISGEAVVTNAGQDHGAERLVPGGGVPVRGPD